MKYELICLDIDGTLLDDEKRLLPEVKEKVRQAAEKGMKIVLGSARMPAGVESIAKELGLECIMICDAGAYILKGEECIASRHLSAASMREVYEEYAERYGLNMWIFRDRDWYITGMDDHIAREIQIIGYDPQTVDAKETADRWEKEQTGPSKLLFAAESEQIRQIQGEIRAKLSLGTWPDIDVACSLDIFLEIFPKGVDKGSALLEICRGLKIPAEKAIAFGDSEMDIPMIETAGLGVAMGNAAESLKKKADFVTITNNEAGVAYALDNLIQI